MPGERARNRLTRRCVDDLARMTALDHPGNERGHTVTDPEHVHAEAPSPVVRLLFPWLAATARRDPRIVEEQVAGAMPVVDLVGEGVDRVEVGDIGPNADHVTVPWIACAPWPAARSL